MGQAFDSAITPFGLSILGGFHKDQSSQYLDERTLNMYDVFNDRGKTNGYLRKFQGTVKRLEALAGGKGRKFYAYKDDLFAVIGANVYLIDSSLSYSVIGVLDTTTTFVDIEANQRTPYPHITFVDQQDGWVWDGTNFTQITDTDFPGTPLDLSYLNGHLFVPSGQSNIIGMSDLNDAFSWQSTNRLAIETNPDARCVGSAEANGRLYFFGTSCIESYYPKGGTSPPFAKDLTFSPDIGCGATASIKVVVIEKENAPIETSVVFLAVDNEGSKSFQKISGQSLIKISNNDLDEVLENYTDTTDCQSYIYSEGGHYFYQGTFQADDHTWTVDLENDRWYEREMLDGSKYFAVDHIFYNGKHYLLGEDGSISEMTKTANTNNGEPMRRLRRMPIVSDNANKKLSIKEIEYDLQRGVGLVTGIDRDPTLRQRISKDGGVTFGNTKILKLSRLGDYNARTISTRPTGWANARRLVIEFETTSDVDFAVYGVTAYIRALNK